MQATLSAVALKQLTRALTCLSRYGDDLVILADAEHFSLSATNSSLSAYSRFRYSRRFFSRYRVGNGANENPGSSRDAGSNDIINGQLPAKTLLSILKHRTIDKTVKRCELSIVEGPLHEEFNEDEDTLESRLIVKLHCQLGIVKTHRLPLMIPNSLLSPGVPESSNESRLTVGPRAIKDITEHFPSGRGMKNDPQLVWTFDSTQVDIKSLETSIDTKGRMQLATELTISSEEFDVYEIFAPPVTIAFHLREFNATIAYAEATGSVLELRFTDPAAPLFIDMEGDESESLFVISTSQIQGMPVTSQHHANPNLIANAVGNPRKRPCPDAPVEPQQGLHSSGPRQPSETPRVKKSTRAVQRTDVTPSVGSRSGTISSESGPSAYNNFNSMSPPSFVPELPQSSQHLREPQPVPGDSRSHEPLFYPSSSLDVPPDLGPSPSRHSQTLQSPLFYPLSQLSQADAQVIRESGLGIEYMDSDGLKAMLEGEGEEVEYKPTQEKGDERQEAGDSLELFEELDPTQQQCVEGRKAFRPLFED